jgi:phosphoglycerate dehydrogenase-like enzyme
MARPKLAIIDDYHGVALKSADWSGVEKLAGVQVFHDPIGNEDNLAKTLAPFEVIALMRERTPFPASLIDRLPNLQLIALTGNRTTTLDIDACTRRGVIISYTTSTPSAATAELAFGLILACARALPQADANMRNGEWQRGLPMGIPLHGKRLGIVGLGKLGSRVAKFGQAFGMDVVAWSQNLTDEAAEAHGVRRLEKYNLFGSSDVVSVHLTLSARSRGVIGKTELAQMKTGAILINTARGPLIDEDALLDELRRGRITAGLDVFNIEPLPTDHALRTLPNVVLTPHLGYVVGDAFEHFYRESVKNVEAFLNGAPINVLNPEAAVSAKS